jgi:enoyl-CoA hydratase/carnithine racemase
MAGPALVVERSAGVWTVTLDRPDRRNALDAATVEELHAALDRAGRDGVRALVLRSSSDAAFCGGLDLTDLDAETDATLLWRLVRIELLLAVVRTAPYLTIALVDGPAIGAGADLVAACRVRLGSPRTSFRFPGIGFGIALGTRHLGSVLGGDRSSRVLLTGATLDSERAHRAGLLDDVLPSARLDAAGSELAAEAARLPATTVRDVLACTGTDQDSALSDLVRSAARPGLRERVVAFRDELRRPRGGDGSHAAQR